MVLTDRCQGGSSVRDGEIELMVSSTVTLQSTWFSFKCVIITFNLFFPQRKDNVKVDVPCSMTLQEIKCV